MAVKRHRRPVVRVTGGKMRIEGKITTEMTVAEAARINVLLERDEPKQAVKKDNSLYCPVCGGYVGKSDRFCDKCGQRLDQENIAL